MVEFYVKTLTGKTIVLNMDWNCTIEEIKLRIEEKENIPISHQRLIWAGKQLEDGRTFGDYNLGRYITMHLVVRIDGKEEDLDYMARRKKMIKNAHYKRPYPASLFQTIRILERRRRRSKKTKQSNEAVSVKFGPLMSHIVSIGPNGPLSSILSFFDATELIYCFTNITRIIRTTVFYLLESSMVPMTEHHLFLLVGNRYFHASEALLMTLCKKKVLTDQTIIPHGRSVEWVYSNHYSVLQSCCERKWFHCLQYLLKELNFGALSSSSQQQLDRVLIHAKLRGYEYLKLMINHLPIQRLNLDYGDIFLTLFRNDDFTNAVRLIESSGVKYVSGDAYQQKVIKTVIYEYSRSIHENKENKREKDEVSMMNDWKLLEPHFLDCLASNQGSLFTLNGIIGDLPPKFMKYLLSISGEERSSPHDDDVEVKKIMFNANFQNLWDNLHFIELLYNDIESFTSKKDFPEGIKEEEDENESKLSNNEDIFLSKSFCLREVYVPRVKLIYWANRGNREKVKSLIKKKSEKSSKYDEKEDFHFQRFGMMFPFHLVSDLDLVYYIIRKSVSVFQSQYFQYIQEENFKLADEIAYFRPWYCMYIRREKFLIDSEDSENEGEEEEEQRKGYRRCQPDDHLLFRMILRNLRLKGRGEAALGLFLSDENDEISWNGGDEKIDQCCELLFYTFKNDYRFVREALIGKLGSRDFIPNVLYWDLFELLSRRLGAYRRPNRKYDRGDRGRRDSRNMFSTFGDRMYSVTSLDPAEARKAARMGRVIEFKKKMKDSMKKMKDETKDVVNVILDVIERDKDICRYGGRIIDMSHSCGVPEIAVAVLKHEGWDHGALVRLIQQENWGKKDFIRFLKKEVKVKKCTVMCYKIGCGKRMDLFKTFDHKGC